MTTTTNRNELSSFYAAFRADDAFLEIIPAFDYHHHHHHHHHHHPPTEQDDDNEQQQQQQQQDLLFQSTLSSTSLFGTTTAIKAGLTYTVPVWMAVVLQQRSFGTIAFPPWYHVENLTRILAFEKQSVSLFPTTTTQSHYQAHHNHPSKQRRGYNDDDDDDDDDGNDDHVNAVGSDILPSDYYELSRRFATMSSMASPTATSSSSQQQNTQVLTLLVQDLFDVRMDKLRQQFQSLLYDTTTTNNNNSSRSPHPNNTDLIINVTGIGTAELAHLQPYVTQAMNDIYYLES